MGLKRLAFYSEDDITIDTLVGEHIRDLQEEAKRLHVEQDLFLCGEWDKGKARVTGYLDPRDYIPGLAISVSPQEYDERIAERVNALIETLDVINIPQRTGLLGFLQRLSRKKDQRDALRQIRELREATYFSLGTEQKPLAPEEVPFTSASVIYSPQQIKYIHLFIPEYSQFVSQDSLSQRLRERDVIGHYHVHTAHHPELPEFFSKEDLQFGAALKQMFQKRKILLGVGYLGKREHYVSF